MKPIVVGMNEVNISTEEQTIIGTDSLGPCVGVLIYSPKHQKSVVFHTSTNWQQIVTNALILLVENGLINEKNFENYVLNKTEIELGSRKDIQKVTIVSAEKGYDLLIYGIFAE